jgi:hypothetical protein
MGTQRLHPGGSQVFLYFLWCEILGCKLKKFASHLIEERRELRLYNTVEQRGKAE